eukprot:gene12111-14313_t
MCSAQHDTINLQIEDGVKNLIRNNVSSFRSRSDKGYSQKHRVQIKLTEKALDKAADKAKRDFVYEQTLQQLQIELVHLQEYIKREGLKVIVIFEGRDAAGKGGVISRISSAMSPRVCRICALSAPSDVEKSQWYFQRYVKHLPAAGEMVLFDRSWYNRAGVERVMGFCSDDEYEEFMRSVPLFEEMLVNSGTVVLKYWFSVSSEEQEVRFKGRLGRSWKRWKLSPMDLFARSKWSEYSAARDDMLSRTATKISPWWVVPADCKKSARLNCISHLLAQIDYNVSEYDKIVLPEL